MPVIQQLKAPIDFLLCFPSMEDNGCRQLFGCQHSLNISSFFVQQKKDTHTGLEQLENMRFLGEVNQCFKNIKAFRN